MAGVLPNEETPTTSKGPIFSTYEGFKDFTLEFLQDVGRRDGDTEEIGNISALLTNYPTDFNGEWSGAGGSVARHLKTAAFWRQTERASKFLARLHDRGTLSEEGEERLAGISTRLHGPLLQRRMDQLQYEYTPLMLEGAGEGDWIRLLHLQSGPGEALKCHIEHVEIASMPFVALSYEWGSPEKLFSIDVVDSSGEATGTISLTDNLHNALCNLRDSPTITDKTFWIDQISINQDDVEERGIQVSLMKKVYSKAIRVISYLGPGDAYDVEAIELLERIYHHFTRLCEHGNVHFYQSRRDQLFFGNRDWVLERDSFKESASYSAWQNLRQIVCGPWMRRLWMVQETCLNDSVLMLRGNHVFPWLMVAAVHWLDYDELLPREMYPAQAKWKVPKRCWEIRGHLAGRTNDSIDSRLDRLLSALARATGCSDPRDSVFGLLALTADAVTLGITADYSKSYEEVLLDVSVRMFLGLPNLRLLYYWTNIEPNDGLYLPSWVVRWRNLGEPVGVIPFATASARWAGPVHFSADGSRLHVSGIRIACVIDTLPFNFQFGFSFGRPVDLNEIEHLESTISTARAHLNGQHLDPDTVIADSLLGTSEWPKSQDPEDGSGYALRALLGLLTTAKHYLRSSDVEAVALRTLLKDFPSQQVRLIETLMYSGIVYGRFVALTEFYMPFAKAGSRSHGVCPAPSRTQMGDVVVLLRGGGSFYILRPIGNDFLYIGDGFVHGLMNGEAFEMQGWEGLIEEFTLV